MKLCKLHKKRSNKRNKLKNNKLIFWAFNAKRIKILPNGIQMLSLNLACLIIMISQVVIFWDHGPFLFGKKLLPILTLNSNLMELKMLISQCSFQEANYKLKKIMSKDSLHKSLGSLNQENQILLNQLLLDQPVKQLCIQPMLTGLRVTEIYHWNSINGQTLSDGSSNIQLHSLEPDNFCGKKDTLLMLHSNKLNNKCILTLISMPKHINKFSLFQ